MHRQMLVASTRVDCRVEMWEGSVRMVESSGLTRRGTLEEGGVEIR